MRASRLLLPLALLALPACAHADGAALLHKPITAGHCAILGSPNLVSDAGIGCSGNSITIDDGTHGKMTLVPSVFGSASSAGILNTTSAQPVIVGKGVATTGADAYDFYSTRIANYSGGTNGFVNSNWRFLDTVSAGTKSFEWTTTAIMDNSASAADATENVAVYAQAHKRNNGGTWASVSELQDHAANPTSPSVTHEYDLEVIGSDTNGSRVILDGWAKSLDGNAAVTRHGIRLNTDTHTTFTNGIELNGAYGAGINLTGGTFSTAAVNLGTGNKLCFDSGCAGYLYNPAGVLYYHVPGGDLFSFDTTGQIGANVFTATNGIYLASTKKLCLDGATCANYVSQSGGVVTAAAGTQWSFGALTALSVNTATGAISGGAISGSSVATSGDIILPTGGRICLNGASCTIYISFNGTSVNFINGATPEFYANMSTGAAGAATGYTVGISNGVSCGGGGSGHQTAGGITIIC